MLVDNWIHFHDLETQHTGMVSDDLHSQVGLAIGRPSPHRCSDAGRIFGINPIHVQGNVIAGGTTTGHTQGFFGDGAHAAFVNVAHGEDFDASAADVLPLNCVDVPHTNQHTVFRIHLG